MKKKRALIVTVGTGTRPDVYIVKPLVKSIEDSRPDFLVLVTTTASRKFGDAIVEKLLLQSESYRIEELKDFDDFQSVFQEVNRIFRYLTEKGYEPDEIQMDFTSGTKAMSGGALLSAVYSQCQSVKYITGLRVNGVVKDGSEKFLTVNPRSVFALHDLRAGEELICHLRFSSASQILGAVREDVFAPEDQKRLKNLIIIAHAYHEWDLFKHESAWQKLKKVEWDISSLQRFRISDVGRNQIEQLVRDKRAGWNNFLIMDLFNNALRREIEGKYDDGVARLYRAAEMFAQNILAKQYSIDTSDVDTRKVPSSMKTLLAKNLAEDSKIRIGLYQDYKLLAEFGHKAGLYYLQNDSLRSQIQERNLSILAHGTKPISQKQFNSLSSSILPLFDLGIPDFEDRARGIQFPWLVSGAGGNIH